MVSSIARLPLRVPVAAVKKKWPSRTDDLGRRGKDGAAGLYCLAEKDIG